MSIIKPKRGTGSPAGSIETNEIAMDTASKTLYVSTDGTDAEILANNTEYFLANNIISGLTNETPTYAGIIKTKRANTAQNFVLTGSEIVRDLGSDGAVLGKEPRTASLDFSVQSDATNTNNSPQNIYAGGFYGGSGSNDGTSPNFLACFAYDDGITSFSKPVIWEGTKDSFTIEPLVIANDGADIIKSDSSLTDGVLNLRVDASAYNKAQAVFEDSNGKAMSLAGQFDTVQARDKAIITLDPGNLHSPTNQANYAGDYAVYFNKEYGDIENPKIEQNVFGARDGFILAVRGDNNGNSDPYDFKPMDIFCEQFRVRARTAFNTTEEVLSISDSKSIFNNTLETYTTTGFSGAARFKRETNNSTTNARASGAFESNYVDSNGALVAPTAGAGAATGWLVNNGFLGALICDLDTVAVDGNNNLDSANSKAKFEIRLYTDGANQQTGEVILTASHDAVIAGKPFENVSLSADPSSPVNGWQYYNSTTHKLRLYANGAWVDLN
tara:strand:- start:183 stop:1679 length:1497 start_codon:yes stop_codon:yes gene_type:complete